MFSNISFEVGALFLLACMLMYGTVTGFVPKFFRRSTAAPILLVAAIGGFLAWRFWPEISTSAASLIARPPASLIASPAASVSSSTPVAPAPKAEAPRKVSKKPVAENWKTTEVDGSVPAAIEPVPAPAPTPLTLPKSAEAPSDDSPYDSGIKRAAKHVGRFFHVGRKKDQQ